MRLGSATPCLVTGASAGIGRATAIALARRGAPVAICARRADRLAETLAACRETAPSSVAIPCDVSDRAAVEAMAARALESLGGIDVLVANAGVGTYRLFVDETPETIEGQVATNLLGQMWCARAVLPSMQERRRGHLVFVSSTNGRIPPPMQSVYNATKFATIGFAEGLSYEVAPYGIATTIVYPGPIDTEFFDAPEFSAMRVPKKVSAERMAEAIVRGVERGRFDVSLPRSLRIPGALRAVFPSMIRRGVARWARPILPRPR